MEIISVEKINEVFMHVTSSEDIEQQIKDTFTYEYPGARYTPQFKKRIWDGKVCLYHTQRKVLYLGLLGELQQFANKFQYQIEYKNEVISKPNNCSFEEINQYVNSLKIASKDNLLDVRDYQLEAIHKGLFHKRIVLLSPTGSGKSLIIYAMMRWLTEQGLKVIIVVPTTTLVEQLYSDFQDYSSINKWSVEDHCQKLYYGFPKKFDRNILISTWQSIYKQPKEWFQQFNAIIGDEAHQFKAKSLTTIMERLINVEYKIGTTGSVDNKKLNHLILQGIFGAIHKVVSTKQLQDKGQLANLEITRLVLEHSDDMQPMDINQEIDFLIKNQRRNKFIVNLADQCKGNTLILFQYVEKHGNVLYELLKSKITNRPIYIVVLICAAYKATLFSESYELYNQ